MSGSTVVYTVEVRNFVGRIGSSSTFPYVQFTSFPHTFLVITGPDSSTQEVGFQPAVPGSPYGPGQVTNIVNPIKGHDYDISSGPIQISAAQYNALESYISTSMASPPYYALMAGAQCTAWAVQGLAQSEIIQPNIAPNLQPTNANVLYNVFETLTFNPYNGALQQAYSIISDQISSEFSALAQYGQGLLNNIGLFATSPPASINNSDGSSIQITSTGGDQANVVFYDPSGGMAASIKEFLNPDDSTTCTISDIGGSLWQSQIVSSNSSGQPISTIQNDIDGTVITTTYGGAQGPESALKIDQENPDGTSQITTFTPTASITTYYGESNGSGSITQTDQENADGTSQITSYNPNGSSTATTYSGPGGTGSVTGIDQENSNGTSQITTYNSDGSTTATTYSGPNGTGTITGVDQENSNGTSQITIYKPDGTTSGTTYSGPNGTGAVIGTDSTQNIVVYNYVGSPYDVFDDGYTPDPDSSPFLGLNETATIAIPQDDLNGSPTSVSGSISASIGNGLIYLNSSMNNTTGPLPYVVEFNVGLDSSGNIINGGVGGFEETATTYYSIGTSLTGGPGYYDGVSEQYGAVYAYYAYSHAPGTWSSPISMVALQVSTSQGETQSLAEALTNSSMSSTSPAQWVTISGPGTVVAAGTEAISYVEVTPSSNLVLQAGTLVTDPFTVDGDGNVTGYGTITGNEVDNGTITASAGTLELTGDIVGSGTLTFVSGGALQLDGTVAATESLIFNAPDESLIVGANADVLSSINGFDSGDQIIVNTTAAATFSLSGSIVSVIENSATVDTLTFVTPAMAQGAIAGTSGTLTDNVLCFLPGALIATPSGETPVEKLAEGNMVLTASGHVRPIAWIGTGRVLATRGRRTAATPVIVRKSALAPNVPHQDLRVTKGHSLFLDGVLIPVEFLVNHRSIIWDDRAQEATIYHLELDTHDVLLANGASAESYRDDGNRWLFQNANAGWHLPPKPAYAPLLTGGPTVDAVWRRLLDRAGPRPGVPLTDDPDLHLLVNGTRLDAGVRTGDFHIFNFSQAPSEVRVVSRAAAPQELGLARDPRCLGVAVRRIVVRQRTRFQKFDANDKRLVEGFHAFEADEDFRWTDGDALLPPEMFAGLAGPIEVVLHIGATAQYIEQVAATRAA